MRQHAIGTEAADCLLQMPTGFRARAAPYQKIHVARRDRQRRLFAAERDVEIPVRILWTAC
jgi:hypothetical protein